MTTSIHYTRSSSKADLQGIIELQKNNLPANLSKEEIDREGFVTVIHQPEDLSALNNIEPHVIGKAGERVVAYLLAMTASSRDLIPVLIPMFELFDKIVYRGKAIITYQYIVVGQVCVDKRYRGLGVIDDCYKYYKKEFQDRYEFAITEIADTNLRSIKAHKRIGFVEIHRYRAPNQTQWSIVLWDWRS